MESCELMDWALKYTELNIGFSTNEYLYNSKLTPEELQKIYKLSSLFYLVSDYFKNNYLNFLYDETSETFTFKYKGVGFEVGINKSDKDCYWLVRLTSKVDYSKKMLNACIDFEDIVNNVPHVKCLSTAMELKHLEDYLLMLRSSGVPEYAISDSISKVLKKAKKMCL